MMHRTNSISDQGAMKFILFRHGHSLANQESRIVSSLENGTRTTGGPAGTGFGLSELGKQEVAMSAKSLSDHILASSEPDQVVNIRILTSPFQRTRQTSDIIYREFSATFANYQSPRPTHGLAHISIEKDELEQVLDLRERFFGEFEMKTPSDDLYTAVWREDANNPFHEQFGVENVVEVTKRMTGVIRDQEDKEKQSCSSTTTVKGADKETWVIIVSHGDSLQILQTAMRGWSGDRHRQLEHMGTAEWRDVQWCDELADAHR
ncbi:hypothetical protein BGZ58_008680 [Dissophora ornata]|nr:hypothetical protein BGZ58_008680 [Dissophora ornata]